MGRLAGKVTVVLDGAQGIGLATVKEFLAEGAIFALNMRTAFLGTRAVLPHMIGQKAAGAVPGHRYSLDFELGVR